MKPLKYIASILLMAIGVLCTISVFYFEWNNDELTRMQVFKEIWYLILGANVGIWSSVYLGFFKEWNEL